MENPWTWMARGTWINDIDYIWMWAQYWFGHVTWSTLTHFFNFPHGRQMRWTVSRGIKAGMWWNKWIRIPQWTKSDHTLGLRNKGLKLKSAWSLICAISACIMFNCHAVSGNVNNKSNALRSCALPPFSHCGTRRCQLFIDKVSLKPPENAGILQVAL